MPTPQSAILPDANPNAIFLTLMIAPGEAAAKAVRQAAAGLPEDAIGKRAAVAALGLATWHSLAPLPASLDTPPGPAPRPRVLARDATVRWLFERQGVPADAWGLPVAGETYDGDLNDINGFHVTEAHVYEALDGARSGPIELGSVGGGTGMLCYDFKGGSGSASRLVSAAGQDFTLGAFVQANFGLRHELIIAGVPVGRHLTGGELRGKPAGSSSRAYSSSCCSMQFVTRTRARSDR